jgi:DNA-directed RNA polymerase subunit L|tara:strand:- start:77 stop:343 length:267 start_codon:yes stop_codon:yes gene_type:complete
MNVEKISKNGNVLKIKILDEDHTFCNLLRREVWNTGKAKTAGYFIEHPQVGDPEFTVDGTSDPKKLLSTAAKEAKKKIDDLKKEISKI